MNINFIKERGKFEDYEKIKKIGGGGFGKAYLVARRSDGMLFSMKMIIIRHMSNEDKDKIFQEARLLKALDHPNIVKFNEVYKTNQGKLCIIMEYADGKSYLTFNLILGGNL